MTFSTIQLLRFIAAFLVLLFHLNLMDFGFKGVDIFFVISGFVMYLNLFSSERPKSGKFFVNRFTKIYLLYWMALFSFYFIKPFPLKSDLFFNSLFLIPGKKLILGLGWTLVYELYFYILIGAIAYLLPVKNAKIVLLCILILSSIVTFLSLSYRKHIPGTTFLLGKCPWEFFLGVLCGYLHGKILTSVKANLLLFMALITMILLITIDVARETMSLTSAAYGLLSMLLVCFLTAYEKKKPIPKDTAKSFTILGDASYAIYLFEIHIAFLLPGISLFSKTLAIFATILMGIILNRRVEIYGLRWCRDILYKLT